MSQHPAGATRNGDPFWTWAFGALALIVALFVVWAALTLWAISYTVSHPDQDGYGLAEVAGAAARGAAA